MGEGGARAQRGAWGEGGGGGVSTTLAAFLAEATATLKAARIEQPRHEARWLVDAAAEATASRALACRA